MARWLYRICIRGHFGKGVFLGFILLYLLFIQSDFNEIDGEVSNPFYNIIVMQYYAAMAHKRSSKGQLWRINEGKNGSTSNHSNAILPKEPLKNNPNLLQNLTRSMVPFQKPPIKGSSLQNENDWKQVYGSNEEYFVYSAYYDTRSPRSPYVRIIAIIQRRVKIKECQLYYEDGTSQKVGATSRSIKEGWNLKYTSSFVLCDASNRTVAPVWVAIIRNGVILQPSFKVIDLTRRVHEGFISVCVKPFHYEYNRALWLVEFIELHQLLGVAKFFFYNHTVGVDVEDVLNHYTQHGTVTVLPWNLPVISQKEIRTEGLFSALNDCNLRNVGRYNYTIMIDLDEYIIPRNHNTYQEMLSDLGSQTAYIFQNSFFYMYWDNDTKVTKELYSETGTGTQLYGSEQEGPYLLTAYKTFRTVKLNKYGQRSKYIANPQKALECGNHIVWEYLEKQKGINVKKEVAILQHYRICEGGGFDCIKSPKVMDRSAHKWLNPLIGRVAETCSAVFLENRICPAAPPLGNPW